MAYGTRASRSAFSDQIFSYIFVQFKKFLFNFFFIYFIEVFVTSTYNHMVCIPTRFFDLILNHKVVRVQRSNISKIFVNIASIKNRK